MQLCFSLDLSSTRGLAYKWTETFPMENLKLSDIDVQEGRALFVDVGGAGGHQCISLRQRFPDLKGKVVLQDQPAVIATGDEQNLSKHEVEIMAYDFLPTSAGEIC